jgi:uncharacterized protein YdaU (DUF1376 family)
MNFYKHHIGDYAKKTADLSMIEQGAYLLMLHAYYGTEKPLPFGRDLYRICRAFGKKERQAVDKVADRFWTKTDKGFVNGRAFEEIENAAKFAETAKENGKKGGRPAKPDGLLSGNRTGSKNKPDGKAIQTPDSISQTPDTRIGKDTTASATPKKVAPDWLAEFQMLYPERGGAQEWSKAIKAGNARLREGHSPAEFLEGARRYHEFCRITGKIGTEYVKQAATFLGPGKAFSEKWDPPATKSDVRLTSNLSAAEDFMRRTEPKNETH